MLSPLRYLEISRDNLGQIELLVLSPKPVLPRFSVNAAPILVVAHTKNFGIVLDSPLCLTLTSDLSANFKAYSEPDQPFLPTATAVTLVLSTLISCLGCHGSLLSSLPAPHSLFLTGSQRDTVNTSVGSHSSPAQYPAVVPSHRE